MAVLVGNSGDGRAGAGRRAGAGMALLMVLAVVSAILGVVFSSVGMNRRCTGHGVAIAGLVVGIVALLPLVLGVVAGVAVFSLG